MVQLNENVDSAVTVSGMWNNSGDISQETTTSLPYLTNLTFQPLATNSSGVYTLTISVTPSDNSPYIIGNSGSTSYNLVVIRKFANCINLNCIIINFYISALPSRPPTITTISRRFSNRCGEVMTLSCTANQVENLFSFPTIVWIAPDGTDVSIMEFNDR